MARDTVAFVEAGNPYKNAEPIVRRLGLRPVLLTSPRVAEYYRTYGYDLSGFEERIIADTFDADAMRQALDTERILGVMTGSDDHLVPTAKLAIQLGLPHQRLEGLEIARCKDHVRQRLQEAGFPQPPYVVVHEGSLPSESPVGYPCVVKPVHESATIGTWLCENGVEFRTALARNSEHHLTTWTGYQVERRWLVEAFLKGRLIGSEWIWSDGRWNLLAFSEQIFRTRSKPDTNCLVIPVTLPADVHQHVERRLRAWMEALGLEFGATNIEFKLIDGEPYIVELNARLIGASAPKMLERVLGRSVVEYLVEAFCGRTQSFGTLELREDLVFAQRWIRVYREGTLKELRGADAIARDANVVDCFIRKTPIDYVIDERFLNVVCWFVMAGRTYDEAVGRANALADSTECIWEA